ncbi:sigma factor-like helix-turn-helix DNA-binding protein [Leucobacter chromiiresistens]|uniref:sigma factor-like helix-turn-helix DNA-binding protein n=1 Tax=Leucobacter chromiiresistens TaxID=1079994 RepID=UPI00115F8DC0|nr:sigma factor-like helix-turn-helix DNA-binding protein [Leucobacter chromiiresistens]
MAHPELSSYIKYCAIDLNSVTGSAPPASNQSSEKYCFRCPGRRQILDIAVERLPDAEPVALTGERLGKLPLRALAAFAISQRHDSGPRSMKLFPALAALGQANPDSSDLTRQVERAAGVWMRLRDEGTRPLRSRAAEELNVSVATLDRHLRRARELNLIATPERPSPEELARLRREGLAAKDIAERFERSVATVNSWIYRARQERPDLDLSRAASAQREDS